MLLSLRLCLCSVYVNACSSSSFVVKLVLKFTHVYATVPELQQQDNTTKHK